MLNGFQQRSFAAEISGGQTVEHDVYEKGEGPVIVILHELPGIEKETIRFADKMVAAGFRVVLPHLFGPLGKFAIVRNMARFFCVRREIDIFARNRSSPIVDWLKALCRDLQQRHAVSGVGVIGMCLTGNFAISLMADESVLASVASQPSLPLFAQHALHMSPEDIEATKRKLDTNGPMHAYRFAGDKLCKAEKFSAIEQTFNSGKERITLTHVPGNKHAMLTAHFIEGEDSPTQAALNEIIGYFREKL
ncbi:dienelactone hydrolase family protein [Hoeflea sp. WL0058]|uniref:Dienelactone hydrolase family protein n=1 Tax=Flavimaribacter sediminis TaxID=2865987 RepID=A0AAE2ZRW5_9HYPH|nr:dienelactone hydrolase family protein [Flavimaribacter sediminis]MBW8639670.1 dienelactone hydrolase family protein [Flavimaribacter sediminis]